MPVKVTNQTPSQLTLNGADEQSVVLAPLEAKYIEDPDMFDFGHAERAGLVHVDKEPLPDLAAELTALLFVVAIPAGMACLVLSSTPRFGFTGTVWTELVWGTGLAAITLLMLIATIIKTRSYVQVARFIAQTSSLVIVLAIGVGLPGAVIYLFGGGRDLLAGKGEALGIYARLLQLLFIAAASLLPVLLYFLFDRFQLGTLRKRLYVNLFRLDRSVGAIGEIHAKLGSQIDEVYGSDNRGRGRLAPGSRWPILVCAFVITIGWIVALSPVGDPVDLIHNTFVSALVPQASSITYGFLGVYFFSLRSIAIRYARGDLKPKAYSSIVARVLAVAILSWVLDVIWPNPSGAKLLIAFLIGITPDAFFTWLKQVSHRLAPDALLPQQTKLPLTDLEGIDLYDLNRLESEGIVNVEGLAHHELIDLIIDTRVPVARLVDWIDQAILYLHLRTDPDGLTKLRRFGIRSATDLLDSWYGAKARADRFDDFRNMLGQEQGLYRLEVIRDSLADDEWLGVIINWRKNEPRQALNVEALPSSAASLVAFAESLAKRRRYQAALDVLLRSLAREDTAGARVCLANLYATGPLGCFDEHKARLHASRALEIAPRYDLEVLYKLAEVRMELQDYAEAKALLQTAEEGIALIEQSKRKEEAQERLAKSRSKLDQLFKAQAASKMARAAERETVA